MTGRALTDAICFEGSHRGVVLVDRNAEVLAKQLLAWPVADRARLAELLIASLETSESDSEVTWDAEINRRAAELDHGNVAGVSVAQVLSEIDRRLGA